MARTIGAVCWLMVLNTAFAQEPYSPYRGAVEYTDPAGNPVSLLPNGDQVYLPVPSGFQPASGEIGLQLTPGGIPVQPNETRLVTKVYGVADLVVGRPSSTDPNQALLAMMAQENDELAMALASATAGPPGAQDQGALAQLAETIHTTYANEFEGRGSITLHHDTKSLVVRQTEAMHDEIRDLLTQLRHVNDTKINVTIEIFNLNDERMEFAVVHHGQVLDEAQIQELREMDPEGESAGDFQSMIFTVTTRNGQSANLPGFVLPGTLTAVASEDGGEVRVVLNMPWGAEMGFAPQQDFCVPEEGGLLAVFADGGNGTGLVLSAEVEQSEEAEQPASDAPASSDRQSRIINLRNSSAELVADAINQFIDSQRETASSDPVEREVIVVSDPVANSLMIDATLQYFDEVVDMALRLDVAPPQIMTEVVLVEAESLPEDFFSWAIGEFGGAIHHDPQSHEQVAVCLEPAKAAHLIEALREENVELTVRSRPQLISFDGHKSEIQVGQVVPVVDTVTFEENQVVPVVEELFVGTDISLVSTVAANNCIEMQIQATHRELRDELNVRQASGKPPALNCTQATTTLTVPQTSTVVWPVRLASDEAGAGRTMLIILTAREVSEAPSAE